MHTTYVIVFERFDLLLLTTTHKHSHRDFWHKAKRFEHSSRCAAAAALLLVDTDLVATMPRGCFFAGYTAALIDRRFVCF